MARSKVHNVRPYIQSPLQENIGGPGIVMVGSRVIPPKIFAVGTSSSIYGTRMELDIDTTLPT